MENDLIHRSTALAILRGLKEAVGNYAPVDDIDDAIDMVKGVNAVDAEPVRRGQLVSTGTDELYCEWGDCTVCGWDNRINAKFCNNCGAKLEGIVTK